MFLLTAYDSLSQNLNLQPTSSPSIGPTSSPSKSPSQTVSIQSRCPSFSYEACSDVIPSAYSAHTQSLELSNSRAIIKSFKSTFRCKFNCPKQLAQLNLEWLMLMYNTHNALTSDRYQQALLHLSHLRNASSLTVHPLLSHFLMLLRYVQFYFSAE